ncbi:hypothetical protein ACOTVS_11750 [Aliarcobacter butzleri]|uniref:hypothetical protein n=1 Tax=Aliarcobacter butzleri TaxID=28197 RepID=UPI00344C3B0A
MKNNMFIELESAISKTRLSTYERSLFPKNNAELIKSYILNSKVSENFYFLLQNLEVTLRNAIYNSYSNNKYFTKSFFYLREEDTTKPYNREFHSYACWRMIGTVKHKLGKGGQTVTDGKIIAELNFGFWTTLFEEKVYKTKIWRKIFKDVFPYYPHTLVIDNDIDNISNILNDIRKFRNRIFHYEQIIMKSNLDKIHSDILNVISWINPSMYQLTKAFDEYSLMNQNKKFINKQVSEIKLSSTTLRKKRIRSKKRK